MYLTALKGQVMKSLRATFDAEFPDQDFRDIKISLEYPIVKEEYPSIWVDFDPTGPLSIVGIGHDEFVVDGTGIHKLYRWRFAGIVSLTAIALTNFERDRLLDALIKVMAFSRMNPFSTFREGVEGGEFIGMNMEFDTVDQRGFSVSAGTPWGTDEMMYEGTIAMDLIGEFYATDAGVLLPVSQIGIVEWNMDFETDPDQALVDPQVATGEGSANEGAANIIVVSEPAIGAGAANNAEVSTGAVSGAVPPLSMVGSDPVEELTFHSNYPAGGNFAPGTYDNMKIGAFNPTATGTYFLNNCTIDYFPAGYAGVTIIADHTTFNSGLWGENNAGVGSLGGSEFKWCRLNGGNRQAIRPKGAGETLIEDTWMLLWGVEDDQNVHTETIQCLDDSLIIVNRSAFSAEPAYYWWGTPITATTSIGHAASVLTDVIVGYWNGSSWGAGGGNYLNYQGDYSTWVRPTLYHNGTSYWYTGHVVPTGSRLVDPVLL